MTMETYMKLKFSFSFAVAMFRGLVTTTYDGADRNHPITTGSSAAKCWSRTTLQVLWVTLLTVTKQTLLPHFTY